jgi:hypothetical protein
LTESITIARFSSRETRVTFSRWSAQVLPTRQTTGAKEPTRVRSPGSSSAAIPRRRVIPNAVTAADSKRSRPSSSKSSVSFGFELGNPASTKWTPSRSRAWTTRSFSAAESDIPCPCMPSRRVVS